MLNEYKIPGEHDVKVHIGWAKRHWEVKLGCCPDEQYNVTGGQEPAECIARIQTLIDELQEAQAVLRRIESEQADE